MLQLRFSAQLLVVGVKFREFRVVQCAAYANCMHTVCGGSAYGHTYRPVISSVRRHCVCGSVAGSAQGHYIINAM